MSTGQFVASAPTTRIAVVMPALDEEGAVGGQVRAILAHPGFRRLPISAVIVVDNGSTDATAREAQAAGATVVSQPIRGYGAACLAGVLAATDSDVVLLLDADGSDDLDGASRVAALSLQGRAELVMGSRTTGYLEPGALTLAQRMGNSLATLLMRLLCGGRRISDIGPLRAMHRADLLALGMTEMTYGWSTEMLVKALRARYRILEVPVGYHRRTAGRSKVSGSVVGALKAGWCILATVLRYARWRPANQPDSNASARTCASQASGNLSAMPRSERK
jgi:glycosyltransferase involved in cell wall biosynthesis